MIGSYGHVGTLGSKVITGVARHSWKGIKFSGSRHFPKYLFAALLPKYYSAIGTFNTLAWGFLVFLLHLLHTTTANLTHPKMNLKDKMSIHHNNAHT